MNQTCWEAFIMTSFTGGEMFPPFSWACLASFTASCSSGLSCFLSLNWTLCGLLVKASVLSRTLMLFLLFSSFHPDLRARQCLSGREGTCFWPNVVLVYRQRNFLTNFDDFREELGLRKNLLSKRRFSPGGERKPRHLWEGMVRLSSTRHFSKQNSLL